mmetsp:Transcript_31821/g.44110  ORF Transcript_31821/g.44110 Transcript_31821/m.44110 type:complete len:107 (+) Transcript_31821:162-482(+)|eukprot:CAMPEP_0196589820 /NCGR_PEP_ID=MMETSP1081-20130531/64725_1 /TAXON_ID=36882 /ORGANISM="Pyramimonas amylifera, Strain CCMP720" /LENGTH=106 /DNA_ID=CAMNT_0041912731 /DNA_START=162 /DNA_END=482 /DNA_ORIENTATION=+
MFANSENNLVLDEEKSRIENSLYHLRKSNEELKQALLADGEDPDYRDAISENEDIMRRMETRLKDIQDQIEANQRSCVQKETIFSSHSPPEHEDTPEEPMTDGQWF